MTDIVALLRLQGLQGLHDGHELGVVVVMGVCIFCDVATASMYIDCYL